MSLRTGIVLVVRAVLGSQAKLAAENLVLRHQLGVLQRSVKRPRLRQRERILWVWLSRLWPDWRSSLAIVKPETVIRWHREGFKLYWRWKSRKKSGRPMIDAEIRRLIRRMSRENATWGSPRIQSELELLGYTVDQSTVAGYREWFGIDINPERTPVQKAIEINATTLKIMQERIESLPVERILDCCEQPAEHRGELELILAESMRNRRG